MNAKEHYQAGNLAEAIAAATDEVKQHPRDVSRRGFLCELLCFAGDLERADLHLDTMAHQDPESMLGISMLRQVLRAEQARQQFYSEGRLPEFLEQPAPHLQCRLEASIRLREGHPGEAAELLEEAERQRPAVPGVCDGRSFDDMRDIDDLVGSFFEVLTSNGKYYWIAMERVESIEFHAPTRPRDLLWRRTHMIVRDGPDGEVFLPTLYAGSHAEPDDRVRLGRYTDWRGGEGTPVQGIGQRMFLIGEEDRPILELEQIKFTEPVPGKGHAPS
jgi:type VI secretion system protein ImpE